MTARDVLMVADCLLAAAAAVLAVTTRQVVHSALWLVVTLGAVAGAYLLLGAELVALVQVLVYVGAIVVLVLFAMMLTRAPIGVRSEVNASVLQRISAAVAGLATAALVGGALMAAYGGRRIRASTPTAGSPTRWPAPCSPRGRCRSSCSRCSCWQRWSRPSPSPGGDRAADREPVLMTPPHVGDVPAGGVGGGRPLVRVAARPRRPCARDHDGVRPRAARRRDRGRGPALPAVPAGRPGRSEPAAERRAGVGAVGAGAIPAAAARPARHRAVGPPGPGGDPRPGVAGRAGRPPRAVPRRLDRAGRRGHPARAAR